MTSADSLLPLILPTVVFLIAGAAARPVRAADPHAIRFNTNFEGASLGKVEVIDPAKFRCAVPGQYDERGRNRQTSWFYFRMDAVRGRAVTLTMTDLVGEYNDRPGAVPYGPEIVPVFSTDGRAWQHFPAADVTWDDAKKEMTLRLKPAADTVWIAHIPPYTPSDLRRLLDDLEKSPNARVEVIGKTAQGAICTW